MGYGTQKYVATVKDMRNGEPITSGVTVFVYTAGTKTLATIYADDANTALANPITRATFATKQQIEFFCASPSVDIYINDALGNESFIPSFLPTDRTVVLSKTGVSKHLVIPFSFNTAETDTGIDLPYGVEIHRAMVEVVTVDATETMDVGLLSSETAGDTNGILSLVPMDNAGFVKPWSITDGATEDFISSPYYGALMGLGSAGTNTANDFGQPGGAGHIVTGSNAVSVVYQHSAGTDTAAGYIHLWFRYLR